MHHSFSDRSHRARNVVRSVARDARRVDARLCLPGARASFRHRAHASASSAVVRRRPSSVSRPETEPPFVRSFELKENPSSVVVGLGTASHASACPTRCASSVRRPPVRRASRLTVVASPSSSSYLSSRVLNPLKRPCARECGRRERRRPHSIDSRPILSTGRVEYDVRTRSGARSARV